MIYRVFFSPLFLPMFLFGCVTNNARPNKEIIIIDNSTLKKFEVTLISNDLKTICIYGDGWISDSGQIYNDGTNGVIYSTKGKFPAKSHNYGYCKGDCYIKIPAKGRLSGSIPYSEFGDESQIAALPDKELQFAVYVNYCEK